jgi:hypothetical protein
MGEVEKENMTNGEYYENSAVKPTRNHWQWGGWREGG